MIRNGCLSIEVRIMDHGQTGGAFGPIGVQALDELQRGASPAGWLETTSCFFF